MENKSLSDSSEIPEEIENSQSENQYFESIVTQEQAIESKNPTKALNAKLRFSID